MYKVLESPSRSIVSDSSSLRVDMLSSYLGAESEDQIIPPPSLGQFHPTPSSTNTKPPPHPTFANPRSRPPPPSPLPPPTNPLNSVHQQLQVQIRELENENFDLSNANVRFNGQLQSVENLISCFSDPSLGTFEDVKVEAVSEASFHDNNISLILGPSSFSTHTHANQPSTSASASAINGATLASCAARLGATRSPAVACGYECDPLLAGPGPENRVEFPELGDKVLEEVFGRPPPAPPRVR